MENEQTAAIHHIGHAGAIGGSTRFFPEDHKATTLSYNRYSINGLFSALSVTEEDVIDRAGLTFVFNRFASHRRFASLTERNKYAKQRAYAYATDYYWALNHYGKGFLSSWCDLNSNALVLAAIANQLILNAKHPDEFYPNGACRNPVTQKMIGRARAIWKEADYISNNGQDIDESARYQESLLLAHIMSLVRISGYQPLVHKLHPSHLEDIQIEYINPALSFLRDDTYIGESLRNIVRSTNDAITRRLRAIEISRQPKRRTPLFLAYSAPA